MTALSTKAFESVTELFHKVSGIKLGENKHALVSGRLQKLAQEAGESNLDAYVDRLVRGNAPAEEMTRVIDRLTTNETYFFREPQHFNDLADRLQAHAHAQAQVHTGAGAFTVWSGASSSGEEAYSISMLMTDVLGTQGSWQIIGTDLSTSVLESARKGLYTMERARMVPPDYLKRFCLKGQGAQDGHLLVAKPVRERVRFMQANLMQPLPQLPMFDVIFLRNVLIYFDNDAKAQIVKRVIKQLKPEGVLYTGHAESLSTLNLPLKALATAVYGHS